MLCLPVTVSHLTDTFAIVNEEFGEGPSVDDDVDDDEEEAADDDDDD